MGDRIIVVLPDDASGDDRDAAFAAGAHEVITRAELDRLGVVLAGAPTFTAAESGVLTELAHRPDTRSRVAARLGITTSTLDNHLAAIKRKVLAHVPVDGDAPVDGYLSMEALIGWAMRHKWQQKT